jgi:hypothetical protein
LLGVGNLKYIDLMSYEEMDRVTRPCRCGKGTIVAIAEMDDWNRWRSYETVNCPVCLAEDRRTERDAGKKERQQEVALARAKRAAEKRYLRPWLDGFQGLSKKAVWLTLTNGGKNYPSLGTFYSHLKDYKSVEDYLKWRFDQEPLAMLKIARIRDAEIEKLLGAVGES